MGVITSVDAERHVEVWQQVAQLVDGSPALPLLGLLGKAAWIAGQGALANLMLERAEQTRGTSLTASSSCWRKFLLLGADPRGWDLMREARVA